MQETYSIRELMARYKCSKSTIFRMMADEGLPRGGQGGGGRSVITGEEIFDWELQHRPHLHPNIDPDKKALMEESEKWRRIREGHDGKLIGEIKKKVTPSKGWRQVRREQKEALNAIQGKIKARRSK